MKIKIGQKFTWNTDDLTEYVEQNIDDLVTQLIEGSKTARLMKTIQGIKGKQELNDISLDFDWQDGSNCDNEPSGGATFGKKYIEVGDIEILMKFCQKDLVGVLPQTKLAPGAGKENETLPFEKVLMDLLIKQNLLKIDTAIWKSDKNSGDANLNKLDGLIKEAQADGTKVTLSVSGNQITSSNAIAAFNSFDAQLPNALTADPQFAYVTDRSTFRDLQLNMYTDLKDSTQFIIKDLSEQGSGEVVGLIHPITNQKIYWVPGLDNTGMVFAGLFGGAGQFYIGTDLESDYETVEVWYEKKDKAIYVRIQFRLGTTYRLGANVGFFAPTAS